jgi:hypothetical protein
MVFGVLVHQLCQLICFSVPDNATDEVKAVEHFCTVFRNRFALSVELNVFSLRLLKTA